MTVKIGSKIPNTKIKVIEAEGAKEIESAEFFKGKKIVLFAVPGAFTPTCSANHLPSYIDHYFSIIDKHIDAVACIAVNDAFVMKAWEKASGSEGKIIMLADGNGDFTKALGLELDATGFGMGIRSKRYSMLVNDGFIEKLFVEEGGEYKVSSAEHMLENL